MQNIVVQLPHVHTIGTNYCDNTRRESFKGFSTKQDVLCHRDYDERAVASFAHQIQPGYYCGNISGSTDVIIL